MSAVRGGDLAGGDSSESQHLEPHGDLRGREPCGRPRRPAVGGDALAGATGLAATCWTSAAGPASTCPRFAEDARPSTGVEPHPDLAAIARRRTRALSHVTVTARPRAGTAPARRVRRRRARALGVLLRSGLRTGAGRARPRRTPRRGRDGRRQRRDPVDVRGVVPARLPEGAGSGGRCAVLVDRGLDPDPGGHGVAVHLPRRPQSVVRIEFDREDRRGDPGRPRGAPRSTTRSISGAIRAPASTKPSTCDRETSEDRVQLMTEPRQNTATARGGSASIEQPDYWWYVAL